jgi:hypothetical protein
MTIINFNFSAGSDTIPEDEDFINKARNLRPFYFIVVCWGESYTNFLFNFCIPSLLAPQNLPALHNRGKNKFLIATTEQDWQRMQSLTAFQTLKEYAEPVFVPLPPCPEGESSCVHMGIGHKSATQIAFEARAYSVLLTPDLMLSDGTMAAVQRHAVSGIQVVLVAALRFGEEPLFKHLESLGIAASESRLGDEGRPLIATGRQFVAAGIKSFHSETLRYEWEAPYFSTFPVACWWHVPEEAGVLVHCLSWAPLLVDYNAIEHHDSSMLDNWTIDGDYVYRNFGLNGKVYVVQDSDEAMLISWAPMSDKEQSLEPIRNFGSPFIGRILKGLVLNSTYSNPVFDPLKQGIFFLPVYWHSKDINKNWDRAERKAVSVFQKFLPIPNAMIAHHAVLMGNTTNLIMLPIRKSIMPAVKIHFLVMKYLMPISAFLMWFFGGINYYWSGRSRISRVLLKAITGDKLAREKFNRHVKYLSNKILGHPR